MVGIPPQGSGPNAALNPNPSQPLNLSTLASILQNINVAINALNRTISTKFPDWVAVPATASSTGVAGQVAYDGTHFYVAVSANTWVRTTLSTF